jgi:ferredoxin-thioredoxin reductase catalytic subunit
MKACGGVKIISPPLLTLALVQGDWSASCPCDFSHSTHYIKDWVRPCVILDTVTKKNSCPCQVLKVSIDIIKVMIMIHKTNYNKF